MLLPQVEASVTDLARFNGVVQLVGFSPFKTALAALESINSISEGIVPEDLQLFLDSCIPKAGKKDKVTLGVADPKLGASITEALNIKCDYTGVVPELLRGIRFHFHNLVKGLTAKSSGVAQLGLGHSYSRAKVKFNVNRVDNMIIQSIALLDQLDKDVNTFSMRIRYVHMHVNSFGVKICYFWFNDFIFFTSAVIIQESNHFLFFKSCFSIRIDIFPA